MNTTTAPSAPTVIIAGGGMAGLVTGAALALEGHAVLVIEKGEDLGGSMRMSGGSLWSAVSMEAMERFVAGGDRQRQRQIVEQLPDGISWLEQLGVPAENLRSDDRRYGCEVDVELVTRRLSTIIADAGGDIARNAALVGIDTNRDGAVTAVTIASDGDRTSVPASVVVLATGGFQGSVELRRRFIPGWPDDLRLRSNPNSTGQALEAALAIGAGLSEGMDGFYGHTMPDIEVSPPQWTAVTSYASQDAVFVDFDGQRFFDESTSMADEHAPMAIVQRPGSRAVMLIDEVLYRGDPIDDRSAVAARMAAMFDTSIALGAEAVTADSWEELAGALAAYGMDAETMVATINEYNAAMVNGQADALAVPRTRHRVALTEPPFRALTVRPGITFTLGGVAVDPKMRVLDDRGTPISGLYAAGADAGGTYVGGYMGGLALGLVQGRIAAAEISSRLANTRSTEAS